MKSKLNPEFLRGILFAFLIWQAYRYLVKGAWIGIYPFFQPAQFFPTFIFGAAYLAMGICLLLSPKKTSKGIFIFLTLFCFLPFLSLYAQAQHLFVGFTSIWTFAFISSLVTLGFWAFIAYAHYRLTIRASQAEQGAAANP